MIRWLDGRPGWWWGWSDLGPMEVPALPPFQLFTDRTTGLIWWLTPNNTFTSVVIVNGVLPPPGFRQTLYTPFNEPYIAGSPGIAQLYVNNGLLAVDKLIANPPQITDIETQPIYARAAPTPGAGFATTIFKMILVSTGPGGVNTYGAVKYVYTPAPNPVCPPPCT